jgi:hypothetical protein
VSQMTYAGDRFYVVDQANVVAVETLWQIESKLS